MLCVIFGPIFSYALSHFVIVVMSYVGTGRRVHGVFKRQRVSTPKDGTTPVSSSQAQVNLAKKVAKLQKVVRGITPEVKFFELTSTFPNISDTAGGVVHQSQIAAGTDITNRIADKVRIKAIRLQVRISTATASIGTTPTHEEFSRFILVQDLQQVSDTTPAASAIVQAPSLPQFPTPALDSNGRFRWLWVSPLFQHARIATSSAVAALTTPLTPSQSPVAFYTKVKCDIPLIFNGTAATDIQKNGLYLVLLTNLAADTLDGDSNVRLDFIDD